VTDVKICGLRDADTMRLCSRLGVKWVGFVFYPPSPRFITALEAARINEVVPSAASGGPERVGLFVKPNLELIAKTLQIVPLDALQVYCSEEEGQHISQNFDVPVWIAKGIRSQKDLPVKANANRYVIEAPHDKEDTRPGGLGKIFDWTLTSDWTAPTPWLLAGGLTPSNVLQAIDMSNASAVDVSSGVEEDRGVKSHSLIEKFVEKAFQRG